MLNLTAAEQAVVKSDSAVKNFRVHFPNGELSDLTNDNIVSESVKFTESVCADSVFRFGCTDASVIEFETVGVRNIMGMVIECSMEFSNGMTNVVVPYGTFVVDSCPRDHTSLQHRQVTAYAQTVSETVAGFEMYKQTVPRYNTDMYTPAAVYMVGSMSESLRDEMTATAVTPYKESTTLPTPFSLTLTNSNNGKFIYLAEAGGTHSVSINFGASTSTGTEMQSDYVYKIKLIKGTDYSRFISLLNSTAESNGLRVVNNRINSAVFTDMHDTGRSMGERFIRYVDKGTYLELVLYPYIGSTSINEYISYFAFYGTFDLTLSSGTDTVIAAGLNVISDVEVTRYSSTLTSIRLQYKTSQTATDLNGNEYNTFIDTYSIRDIVEGWAELSASFGRCNRDGSLEFIHLDNSTPYALTADDVKQSAWWDEYDVNPIGSVLFKYKNGNKEMTAQYYHSADPSVYDMSGNEILKNMVATVATASVPGDMTNTSYFYLYDGSVYFYDGTSWVETVKFADFCSICMALIQALFMPYADTVQFTPLDADLRGMPYLQCGDAITLTAADGVVINSYILNHTFNGIQAITEDVQTVQGTVIGQGVAY